MSRLPILAAVASALLAFPLRAQEEKPAEAEDGRTRVEVPRFGMEALRYLLYQANIDPIERLGNDAADHRQTIIILLGEKSVEEDILTPKVLQAVRNGASILIATDRAEAARFLENFNVRITNEDVIARQRECYNGAATCPFVRPLSSTRRQDPTTPQWLFEELDEDGKGAVATNRPSVLRKANRSKQLWFPLAKFPDSARMVSNNGTREFEPNVDLFALGGPMDQGRFLILADHSLFTNRMVLVEDNANLAFTLKCIAWLQGPEKKNRCYFVEDGEVKTDFSLPIPPDAIPPFPWLEMALRAMMVLEKHGDSMVAELEQKDFFNSMILSRFSRREIVRSVVIFITLFLLLFGFFRLLRNRIGADPARILVTPELAALIPRGNVLQQRFDGLLASDNVWEASRHLVRDFISGLNAEPDAHGNPPPLEIEPHCLDEAGLRRQIMRLWQVGYGPTPLMVKPEEWPQLTEDLKSILDAADRGEWKFVRQAG